MTRLRSLIKEVLSQPKKKDCNCGCNDCGGKAPILTEGKVKHLISEDLQYHMDKKIQLHESVYRIGSEKHFELIREARALWVRGIINVSEDDQAILETNLGHFGMYEGEAVPLDMPMVNEDEAAFEYNKARAGRIMKDLFGPDFEFDYTYKLEGDRIIIHPEGYNPDGTLFDMKGVHKEKIIRTFRDKMPKAQAQPNMGGGITVNLKESLDEGEGKELTYLNEKVLSENQLDRIEDWKFQDGWGFIKDYRREDESGPNKKIAFLAYNPGGQIEKSIKDIEKGDVIVLGRNKRFKVDYIDPWSAGGRILNGTDLESGKKGQLKVKFLTPKGDTGLADETMLTVKDLSKGQSLNVGLLDKLTPKIGQRLVNQLKVDYLPSAMKITKDMIKQAGVDMVIVVDHNVSNKIINESKKKAKSKKKDPPIGKPKRGGSKAYYVYVRDPKTKRIKKVSFGSGGLRAKIRNPKARKAFAARHRCAQKNDRTKASYWSCRLPRYAKQLGLGSNMNTFW